MPPRFSKAIPFGIPRTGTRQTQNDNCLRAQAFGSGASKQNKKKKSFPTITVGNGILPGTGFWFQASPPTRNYRFGLIFRFI